MIKKDQPTKRLSFNMAITPELRVIIDELQEHYSVNVSQLLKNALVDHHRKLKQLDNK